MITRLTIENFKAFEYAELNLTELNLLTGVNGVGKSSVIQALLLLRQSQYTSMEQPFGGLLLKGPLVDIGLGRNAQNINATNEQISFEVEFDTHNDLVSTHFNFNAESDFQPYADGSHSGNVGEQPAIPTLEFSTLIEAQIVAQYPRRSL